MSYNVFIKWVTVQFNNSEGKSFNITYNDGINALDYDSDDDGVWDSVEYGLTGIKSSHSLTNVSYDEVNWTDNSTYDPPEYNFSLMFKADGDGGKTRTDMTNNDTDYDGLEDGEEDSNNSGTWDFGEPNPLDGDTDDDGVMNSEDGTSIMDNDD